MKTCTQNGGARKCFYGLKRQWPEMAPENQHRYEKGFGYMSRVQG